MASHRATPALSSQGSKSPELSMHRKKITKEDEERLTDSLFRQAIERKKKSLEQIEASVYKYEPPKVISKEQAEESANRQCNEELERRKKKHEDLQARHHPPGDGKVISSDDLQSIITRNYDEATRIKKERVAALLNKQVEADRKMMVTGKQPISKEQMLACGDRLSKPVKREFTHEEILKLTVYPRQ